MPKPEGVDNRRIAFLEAYYGESSATKRQIKESALVAGYSKKSAYPMGTKILNKCKDLSFRDITDFLGVNRITIGLALKKVIKDGKDRDIITAARLLLSNMGEVTDATTQKNSVTTVNMPTIVYMGETASLLKALKRQGKEKIIDVKESLPALHDANVERPDEIAP